MGENSLPKHAADDNVYRLRRDSFLYQLYTAIHTDGIDDLVGRFEKVCGFNLKIIVLINHWEWLQLTKQDLGLADRRGRAVVRTLFTHRVTPTRRQTHTICLVGNGRTVSNLLSPHKVDEYPGTPMLEWHTTSELWFQRFQSWRSGSV